MTGQRQHDAGPPSDEANRARESGAGPRAFGGSRTSPDSRTRWRGPLVGLVAAGIALGVMAGWAVITNGTGAAEDAPASGGQPVAASEDELLHRASERLITRCMARHGFTYEEQPPSPTDQDFRYVLDDVGWAREHGYGTLVDRARERDQDANFANLEKLTPRQQRDWQEALQGSGRQLTVDLPDLGRISGPDNGCTAEARRTLFGDLAGWYRVRRIVDHLGSYVAGRVTAAPEYRTGLAAWSACVRQRGYAASSPQELRELVAPGTAEPAAERAPAPEVAAAETEAECAGSTGFSRTIGALEGRYRPEIERRFAREIEGLRSFEREAIPRARQALADA
ncbi:hypothetical protein BDK92_7429 [Micromonospora pisi]|uniref:Uncharacterized protein n=1 Tax=Micromonospora pisi TaxID=589240 RepID=A0A495JVB3_9ACTN|nr:hypothetical protein [Micromonospora pisi]RKR92940.1 hypothetical protein BDK92_7429 [Micromonospora pisi]